MVREQADPGRRHFLRTAAITAVAATAAGAGAAKLTASSNTAPTIFDTSPVSVPQAQAILSNNDDLAALFAKLAAAQAENVRLKAELDASQRNLSTWQQSGNSSSTQLEAMSVELDGAHTQLGVLSGLVALYEQLDEVDVSDLMSEGLTAVSESINTMIATSPFLAEGIALGNQALDELEAHLPLLENGRLWLERHSEKLQDYFNNLQDLLQKAVDTVEPFLEMLTNWFSDVRKWLPFNLGQKAAAIMASATTLLSETPHTISGLDTNVMQPLNNWLAQEDGDMRIRHTLIKPLREKVIGKASELNLQAQTVKQTYEENVVATLETAVTQRRALHETISQYRQENLL